MQQLGCRSNSRRDAGATTKLRRKADGRGRPSLTVDPTTLVVGTPVDVLDNGKGLMLALATGVSGSGVTRGLDFRRTGGAASGFGGMGRIPACRHVSGAVPIHIAHGDARCYFRFGDGRDGFCGALLVPVVLRRLFPRGLPGGNIAGCNVPVNDRAVFGLLVHAAAAGLARGEVTRALSLRGGGFRFLLIGLRLSSGEER